MPSSFLFLFRFFHAINTTEAQTESADICSAKFIINTRKSSAKFSVILELPENKKAPQ